MSELYFAYGSNMEPRRFKRYCPHGQVLGRARLPGYRLDFTRYSTGFRGGVADIVPDAEAEVWGVLSRVEESDLASLDEYEGVPVGYRRERLTVIDDSGREHAAVTYVANRTGHFAPSKGYVEIIVKGARERGLPADYVRQLEQIRTT
jgi:gamma-glutamylcyclotransferase (GGCT)/AIG2-like uncharacterized protein YtfP